MIVSSTQTAAEAVAVTVTTVPAVSEAVFVLTESSTVAAGKELTVVVAVAVHPFASVTL